MARPKPKNPFTSASSPTSTFLSLFKPLKRNHFTKTIHNYILIGLIVLVFVYISVILNLFRNNNNLRSNAKVSLRAQINGRRIPNLNKRHNAIAIDILRNLDCEAKIDEYDYSGGGAGDDLAQLMKDQGYWDNIDNRGDKDEKEPNSENRNRRLDAFGEFIAEEEVRYMDNKQEDKQSHFDTPLNHPPARNRYLTAKHLLCIAAGAGSKLPWQASDASAFACDTNDKAHRIALLDLWSSARSQMTLEHLKTTLSLAHEHETTLVDHVVNLWSPVNDIGVWNSVYEVNDMGIGSMNTRNDGQIDMESLLGPGKLFVDVGSNIGVTTLATALLHPQAIIVSIEPASPSWLLQRLNLICNLPHPDPHQKNSKNKTRMPRVILSGVGPEPNEGEDSIMSKMMWRPSSTTSTRTWTPVSEHQYDDMELTVRLRTLRSIVMEGLPSDVPVTTEISVLNLDCEGCEYNAVPSLSKEEFQRIGVVTGGLHWGYIPLEKKPSSERGKSTHERLCLHEIFAATSIECCDVSDLEVTLLPRKELPQDENKESRLKVRDVAGSLCDKFYAWSQEKSLHDVTDEYGWFELTSMSGIEDEDEKKR